MRSLLLYLEWVIELGRSCTLVALIQHTICIRVCMCMLANMHVINSVVPFVFVFYLNTKLFVQSADPSAVCGVVW